MPCSLPRWTGSGARRLIFWRAPAPGFFPVRTAFPVMQTGRHPHLTFEACSSFTHVTACKVAHPPYVGFIARLRLGQFPGSDARKLPSPTDNCLGGTSPQLVIRALGAHCINQDLCTTLLKYCLRVPANSRRNDLVWSRPRAGAGGFRA